MLSYGLEAFSFETTRKYVLEKEDYLKFTDRGFERLYKCTRGIPFYINVLLGIFSPNEIYDESKVMEDFGNALPFLAINFINDWKNLTKQEQKIVASLIEKPLRRIDIAKKLNVTSGGFGASLNNLFNKGLILYENKCYYISDYVLKAWLKKEYDKRGVYP